MAKVSAIYKITSPTGRIYIGQSINVYSRWLSYKRLNCKDQPRLYFSLKKYGYEAHSFEIVEKCLKEKLNEREIYYGILFNSLDKKTGLNNCLGNSNYGMIQSAKDKISRCMIKRFKDPAARELMRNHGKRRMKIKENRLVKAKGCVIFSMKGRKIKSFDSLSDAGRFLKKGRNFVGKITNVCKGKRLSAAGYVFRYLNDSFEKYNVETKCRPIKKPIISIDKNGKINKYKSATEASRLTCINRSDIRRSLKGIHKTKGLIWKYDHT